MARERARGGDMERARRSESEKQRNKLLFRSATWDPSDILGFRSLCEWFGRVYRTIESPRSVSAVSR